MSRPREGHRDRNGGTSMAVSSCHRVDEQGSSLLTEISPVTVASGLQGVHPVFLSAEGVHVGVWQHQMRQRTAVPGCVQPPSGGSHQRRCP